jgi:hypothetical protein
MSDVLRITFGVDPGISGAIAVLADGEPASFIDMPNHPRLPKGNEIDAFSLCAQLRGVLQAYRGAFFSAAMERISTRPTDSRINNQSIGEGYGILKGVFASLGVRWCEVRPQQWKKHCGLIGTDKDQACVLVRHRFPRVAGYVNRKKDNGRADACLIGRWAWETESFGPIKAPHQTLDLLKGVT